MPWNWELPHWPQFHYRPEEIAQLEKQFLFGEGGTCAYLKTIDKEEYHQFIVEILSSEGMESSKIEGELLDRESLQSSIQRHFGIQAARAKDDKASRMAALLCDVYTAYDQPLTHEMLFRWHSLLFGDERSITDRGTYRTHAQPMQIVSNRYGVQTVFFEAPPSEKVFDEMERFIRWFNSPSDPSSILGKAALSHVYFESIHPFEDGNGRMGRVLVEKALSQGVGRRVLIAISKRLEQRKKEYYAALEQCNCTLDVHQFVQFFSAVIVQAHEESMRLLYFLICKSKMLSRLSGEIHPRQMKVLLRIFQEGPDGFRGGLSAENYIAITKTTRATATRDLADLVEKGALFKTGELRHTRYFLHLPS
jgi:Fic family protein